jgi:hypothetical protein
MVGRCSPVWLFAIVCLAGCSQSYKTATDSIEDAQELNGCKAVVESLQYENLPALESVDIWRGRYGPGLRITTAHYEIYTTLLEPLTLRQIPGFMESAYRAYNRQLPQPIETTGKLRIYLFADRQQWEGFTKSFAGEQAELFYKIKAGAYYLNGACVTYYIGTRRTLSALGHEGWHQFNNRHFRFCLPSWLDEGIAVLFETSRYEGGRFYFEPNQNAYRLEGLRETLVSSQQIPLSELVAMNPGEVLAIDQAEAVRAFYSQAYALVRFLKEADSGKHADKFRRLIADGLMGEWPLSRTSRKIAADRNMPRTIEWNRIVGPQLVKQYISSDIDQLEREYLAFCRQIINNTPLMAQSHSKGFHTTVRFTLSAPDALLPCTDQLDSALGSK